MTTAPPPEIEELIAQLPTLKAGQQAAPYPHADEEAHGGQDDLAELGAPGDAPNTSREAIRLGRDWIQRSVFLGVGYCLRAIRSLFGVAALYPDASTAWEEASRQHRTSDPGAIPWGVPVWWVNSTHGHVALSLGRGRCLTTDYVETGELGVAPIAALGPWCGGRLVGWSNDINGVDVWEPPKPPNPWGLEERRDLVRAALQRALENQAPERRIEGLRRWLKALNNRIEEKK